MGDEGCKGDDIVVYPQMVCEINGALPSGAQPWVEFRMAGKPSVCRTTGACRSAVSTSSADGYEPNYDLSQNPGDYEIKCLAGGNWPG